MVGSVYPGYALTRATSQSLMRALGEDRSLWIPRTGADGLCRLLQAAGEPLPEQALPTFIPLKKILLPHRETVWSCRAGRYLAADVPAPFAAIGLTLCDLQAVWYLDQVFADDSLYQARRGQSLLVAMACEPGPECRCSAQLMPPAGDIFISSGQALALSAAGGKLLQAAGCELREDCPLPWPEGLSNERCELTPASFYAAAGAAVWDEEGKRCLGCGACSVVCPTCYCFDMQDAAAVDGTVTRQRVWDNCFFAEHGKVAGDYDFRPGRAHRLRFRMEHKRFGFGALRGQDSCVGCGRCRKVCPVDIDLDRIAERLCTESTK